jgi:hypothetical protein
VRGRDRRPRFRDAVYAGRPGMTDGCRVLLLRLADSMDADGYVSIPRTRLAAQLGVAPARISERIKLARSLGFLDIAEAPRPRFTAKYQGMIPDAVRGTESVPLNDGSEVQPPVSVTGTESVPLSPEIHAHERYACTPPNSKRPPTGDAHRGFPEELRIYGEPGQFPDLDESEVDRVPNEKRQLGEVPHESTAEVRDRARHEYDEEASA